MRNYFRTVTAIAVLLIIGSLVLIVTSKGSGVPYVFIAGLVAFFALFLVGAYLYGVHVRDKIAAPLENMRVYAYMITRGNLDDIPETDINTDFGEFSESFNIVCDELQKSWDREALLRQRQREFVTSLGQELKTPVTGIRLTAENLRAGLISGKDLENFKSVYAQNLDSIYDKAAQIEEDLIELTTSALDDLGEIRVCLADEKAQILEDILRKHDDRQLVFAASVPDVLINVDRRRMDQVIGNIIVNSYQYADTQIDVSYLLLDDFLQMMISDHGPGVATDEIDHITDRFYRSRLGASSKDGNGLGLYTARLLMKKMNGELMVANTGDGLCVTLLIPVS